jgi:hypothetical protein
MVHIKVAQRLHASILCSTSCAWLVARLSRLYREVFPGQADGVDFFGCWLVSRGTTTRPRPSSPPPEQGVIDRHGHRLPGRQQQRHRQPRDGQTQVVRVLPGPGEEKCARSWLHPGASMPHIVRFPVCAANPQARQQSVRKDGAVNNGAKPASSVISDAGTGSVASGSIGGNPFQRRFQKYR